MKVLVTGGAGFIGSSVCRLLASINGNQVMNLDALTYAARVPSLGGHDKTSKDDPLTPVINPHPATTLTSP
jgi:dTDP-D-glucose 4,6-dehydratase